jgi:hypothetical protein
MAELDFSGLRAEVEAATMLPGFEAVTRRARRARTRTLLTTLASMLVVLAILGPAGVMAAGHRGASMGPVSDGDTPSPVPIGPVPPSTAASSPPAAAKASLVAAGGIDLNHLFALVDVCRVGSCNLQLSRILPEQVAPDIGPERVGLLRDQPTDRRSAFQLTAITDRSLQISGAPPGGTRQYLRVDLGLMTAQPTSTAQAPRRAVQLAEFGPIQLAGGQDKQVTNLPNQPGLGGARLVTGVALDKGIWVTGVNERTGELAVGVSRDTGRHWTVTGLGAAPGTDPPAFASYDGHTGYLLTRTASQDLALYRTGDGGQTWRRLAAALPWPRGSDPAAGYGLIVRPDGSLLAWLNTSPATVYVQSTDGGASFTEAAGPGGPIIAVADGYLTQGLPAKLSRDGRTWVPARVPYLS